jgi:NAD(P)-dependent dehydrogenase (short-subunit alcohol dehydrogenase family)
MTGWSSNVRSRFQTRKRRREQMGALDGKVAIITGAGGGIGRAHALAFAKEGCKVVVNDLGGDRAGGGKGSEMADSVVAEIKKAGGDAVANYDSVATREGADGMVWSALSKFGKLDVLVNNAGVLRDRSFMNMSDADWNIVFEVHMKGTWFCSQAVARHLKIQNKGGRIINTTSVSGLMGNFGQANYSAAKAGIYGFTRTLSIELRKANITVNAIAPVAFTRMTEDLPMLQAVPNAKELLAPEHIAKVAVFLASDLSSDITGQIVGVQGTKVSLYKMLETSGATPKGSDWTNEELRERWAEISK